MRSVGSTGGRRLGRPVTQEAVDRRLRRPGERVREARKAAGLSQCELAELSGATQTTVSAVETGRYPSATATIVRLLEGRGIGDFFV